MPSRLLRLLQSRHRVIALSRAWRTTQTQARFAAYRLANASFRGYADYMDTPEFRTGLGRLIERRANKRTGNLLLRSRVVALFIAR